MTATAASRAHDRVAAPARETDAPTPVVWALCILAFSLPLEFPDRFAFEVSAMTGALAVASTLLAPSRCYGRVPWAVGGYALFILAMLVAHVALGAAYPGGLYTDDVTKQVLRLAMWVLLFWAASNLLRDPRVTRVVLWWLVIGCFVRVALPLLGLARSTSMKGVERVTALGQNPNQSAQVLAIGLLALIGLTILRARGLDPRRMWAWAGMGLLAVGIVQTGSRGGLATAALGTLVLLGTGPDLRTRFRNVVIGIVVFSSLGVLALRTEAMRDRVEKTMLTGHASGRELIWPATLKMVVDRPLLGWGPATNKRELASRLNDPEYERRDTHNVLLELMTSCGLLGTVPFLLATFACLRASWRGRTGPLGGVPLAMMVAMLIGNMTQNRLIFPVLWLVLAIGLAAVPHAPEPAVGSRRA